MAEIVNMPKLGLGMTFGIITKVLASEGQQVKKNDVLVEFETNKLTDTLEAPIDGVVLKMCVKVDDEVPIRKTVFVVGQPGDEYTLEPGMGEEAVAQAPTVAAPVEKAEEPKKVAVNISPLARKIADEKGIDINKVTGSGPNGRIMKEDVLAYAEKKAECSIVEERIEPMSPTRKSIAHAMAKSKHDVPHVYLEICADVTALESARKRYAEDGPGKVSYNDIILYASVLALKENMDLNASVDGDSIVRHGSINLGVATICWCLWAHPDL